MPPKAGRGRVAKKTATNRKPSKKRRTESSVESAGGESSAPESPHKGLRWRAPTMEASGSHSETPKSDLAKKDSPNESPKGLRSPNTSKSPNIQTNVAEQAKQAKDQSKRQSKRNMFNSPSRSRGRVSPPLTSPPAHINVVTSSDSCENEGETPSSPTVPILPRRKTTPRKGSTPKSTPTKNTTVQGLTRKSPRNKSPAPAKGKGNKGKAKTQSDSAPYFFIEEQEEAIAHWLAEHRILYDMKDKHYKDKGLRRQLWEDKAKEYGVDYDTILKWYHTQRTRFSKLREGQTRAASQKNGLSSGDEEEFLSEEASEKDSDRDKFIRRVFSFLRPHIRRHNKDTPASFKDKLALAQTGELAGSDSESLVIPTPSDSDAGHRGKRYSGFPSTRPPIDDDAPESFGSTKNIHDKLVEYITREESNTSISSRSSSFCTYLASEMERLHEACMEPAYEEIMSILNHYRKTSRTFRLREARGERISQYEEVPPAFPPYYNIPRTQFNPPSQRQEPSLQDFPIQRAFQNPGSTSQIYPRVSQLQQESAPPGTYPANQSSTSPNDFQPHPAQWPRNPPPASVWKSQESSYVHQANQQYSTEQQQGYNTIPPASTNQGYQGSRPSVLSPLTSAGTGRNPWQPTGPSTPPQGRSPGASRDSLTQYLQDDDRINQN